MSLLAYLTVGAYLALGIAAGAVHFGLLRWNTSLYATGGLAWPIGVQVARMVALGGMLGVIAIQGALPLLATTAGIFLARAGVVRWCNRTAG